MSEAIWLAVLLAFVICLEKIVGGMKAGSLKRIVYFDVGIYLAYMICLLGMYLFNMREGSVGSFERYEKGIHILLLGSTLLWMLKYAECIPVRRKFLFSGIVVMTILTFGLNFANLQELLYYDNTTDAEARDVSAIVKENGDMYGVVYTADEFTTVQKSGAELQYYYYDREHQHHENYRVVSNLHTDENAIDHWREWGDYLYVMRPDEYYYEYAERENIDKSLRVIYR